MNPKRSAFTLVELIVVLGIITIAIGLTMPAISGARRESASVRCRAKLREIGIAVAAYAQNNKGHLLPAEPGPPPDTSPIIVKDWAGLFFGPNDRAAHVACPSAPPDEVQTYMLNSWLTKRRARLHSNGNGNTPTSEIIVCGENLPPFQRPYLPQLPPEEPEVVYAVYRHGTVLRSNYLWLDFHVGNELPKGTLGLSGSWDLPPR